MNPSQPSAEPATFHGVSVRNETILASIRNAIKLGWGNERICQVIGMPSEVVDRERTKLKKIAEQYK